MGRPKLGDSDSKRLQMVITPEELEAIDDWAWRNRIRSKSEAIRRLCQIGIEISDRVAPSENLLAENLYFNRVINSMAMMLELATEAGDDTEGPRFEKWKEARDIWQGLMETASEAEVRLVRHLEKLQNAVFRLQNMDFDKALGLVMQSRKWEQEQAIKSQRVLKRMFRPNSKLIKAVREAQKTEKGELKTRASK